VVITSGSRPSAVVIVVISTGLSFDAQPSMTACLSSRPFALRCSNLEIKTRPSVRARNRVMGMTMARFLATTRQFFGKMGHLGDFVLDMLLGGVVN